MNTPYVKKYNESGSLINPINGAYLNFEQSRKQRREKQKRFVGNGRNHHLTVLKQAKFHRLLQRINCGNGTVKQIEHYLLN